MADARCYKLVIAVWLVSSFTCSRCGAVNNVAGDMILFNDNGAWSWFEDERAIVDASAGKILVSSVADASGSGGSSRDGDVEVAAFDLASRAVSRFNLSDALQADDHNSAALWKRSDGRYVALYAQHGGETITRYRVSNNAGSIASWGPELTISNGAGTTYSNLHFLSAENSGNGRLYNIARTVGLDPHVVTSSNQGQTWAAGGRLLDWPTPTGDPKFTGTDGSRPYLKYASNGVNEIHFITTEDHPRAYDNSIYHGVIRNGQVYDSFGVVVDTNLFDGTAKRPNEYTTVFDTDASPLGFAWTTDLALDQQGRPYAAMTARANNDDSNDHRFLYARFDGTRWNVHEVAKAGGFLYSAENDYTGLMALDPNNPDRIFVSTKIDPRTNISMGHYEIFEGKTTTGGASWTWSPITFNSTVDNLRPIVPAWDDEHTALLRMRGTYTTFTNYNLDIVGLTEFVPFSGVSGDLDSDGDLDLDDYALYLSGLHANLSGLTPEQAFMRGDLNADSVNDFDDFVLFRQTYDLVHGAGAFAAHVQSVPEPSGPTIIAFGVGGLILYGGRNFSPAQLSTMPGADDLLQL